MDLLPVSDDYDQLTDTVRKFSAQRLMEMIEALRPFIAEILQDPEGVHDLEANRILAYTSLLKLHTSLIKDLGHLYRAHMPPPRQDDAIPAELVTRMLEDAAQRHQAELETAIAQAEARTRAALEQAAQHSLQAARDQVRTQIAALRPNT
jgi:hypothetical protein